MIIDSHSHLFDKQYDGPGEREVVIARMQEAGVSTITVGTSYVESLDAVALAEKLNMWATIGQHPTDTFEEFDYDKYKALAANKCVVGIGECGLDYVQSKFSKLAVDDEKARQSALFIQQVALASELAKPLMIHCRPSPGTLDAYTDLLKLLTTTMIYHSGA